MTRLISERVNGKINITSQTLWSYYFAMIKIAKFNSNKLVKKTLPFVNARSTKLPEL